MKKVIISILIGLSVFSLTQCGSSEKQVKEQAKQELKAELEKEQEEKELKEKGYTQKDIEGVTQEQYQEWCDKFYETSKIIDSITGISCPAQEGYNYCNAEQAKQYMEQVKVLQQQYSDSFPDFIKDKYNNYIDKTCEFANNVINTGNVNQDMTEEQQNLLKEISQYYDQINEMMYSLDEDIK